VIGGLAHPNGKRGAIQAIEINWAPGEGVYRIARVSSST
jgi:hypothetical protein